MRTFIHVTLCATLCTGLVACRKEEPETKPAAPVQVAPAITGKVRVIVSADAVLYPREQANITPKIAAPVRRFLVSRGDHVKAGQLLAELENRDLAGAAQDSRGQYLQADAAYKTTAGGTVPEQLAKANADLQAARDTLDAATTLLASRQQLFREGALPRKQVDEAQVQYAQAKAAFDSAQQHLDALEKVGNQEQIRAAQGQLESARGRLESARAQMAYSEIRSPFDGVVTDRPLYPGELAATDKPVLTVMDISKVVARISMSQEQANEVRAGNEAMMAPADGTEPVAGKVIVVSPATDPQSTTVQVWVQADNPGERLRAGQSVHVAIVARTIDGATLVPAAAILAGDEGATIVKVVDDQSVAHDRPVQVGAREPEVVQIVSGLEPGERVITEGGVGLEDRASVRIISPGEKKAGDKEDDKDGKN
jgi:multidrug efflux pump subunit AcrA (membrane-fusion protein)